NILLYAMPANNNPSGMTLTDVIENLGCSARDSIKVAQGDVYFLSDSGIYKIPKLAQSISLLAPVKVSKLVADDVIDTYAAETLTAVRAGFHPLEKLMVMNAPVTNKTWVFHVDRMVPDPITG